MTKANANPDREPEWEVAYIATKAYNLTSLADLQPMKFKAELIAQNSEFFDFVIDNFFAGGPEKLDHITNKNLAKYISCRFRIDVFDDYLRCTKYKTCRYLCFLMF